MGWTRVDAVGQLDGRRDRRDCSIGLVRSLNRLTVYIPALSILRRLISV